MKIGTATIEGQTHVIFEIGGRVVPVVRGAATVGHFEVSEMVDDLLSLIESGPDAWNLLEQMYDELRTTAFTEANRGTLWLPAEDVVFEPPIRPRKNPWVVGANYYQHLANGYARIPRPAIAPPHVEYFSKALSSLVGHEGDIVYDKRATRTVDYECELTVVIGKPGKDIPAADAMDWVFGYTIANDVSARELQLGHRQYFRGKSLDGFCPLGPVIVTPRDSGDPMSLRIRQWVNGELKQDWPAGDMIYKIDELISVLSQGMTIEPGELIVCGTVPGVGFEQLPQSWLQHGDVLEAEISRIGLLRNTVKMAGI